MPFQGDEDSDQSISGKLIDISYRVAVIFEILLCYVYTKHYTCFKHFSVFQIFWFADEEDFNVDLRDNFVLLGGPSEKEVSFQFTNLIVIRFNCWIIFY